VGLVEKMGSLYTQHYSGKSAHGAVGGKRFDLMYEGELASISNTRPLFAALVKGITSSISDSGGRDVNIVNANLIAKEKGIVINETHTRESSDLVYASLVTLRTGSGESEQVISGYVSGKSIYISKLDKFNTSFVPEGTLLILHNYDEPGKIGGVGSILGQHGINIKFMSVAALDSNKPPNDIGLEKNGNEALMILGIEGTVSKEVEAELRCEKGILNVSAVRL
jgi:D-3-phosphoglycerate dehydrogenase / 2-oxoglutarate reductase